MAEVLDGVEPLLERYDDFLVDQFGVLFDGAGLLPEAREAMLAIRRAGRRVVILSPPTRPAAPTNSPCAWRWCSSACRPTRPCGTSRPGTRRSCWTGTRRSTNRA